ncbi:hypothetical protein FE783_12790 [Paenibacillus mesophilus]|uniref:hypothetical protein n=1 Tax=Paenibacillus mesophilus TaxID=2582849 RepID=UPI00110F37A2|nr:hypothetical protein [Paenibacillus mesophilus]TMV49386.1 hypothetical protein FE783_12790 [Paenibacillus mesophilus]
MGDVKAIALKDRGEVTEADQAERRISELENENDRLKSEIRVSNDVVDNLRSRVRMLEEERERNKGYVFIRVPVLPGDHPIHQHVGVVGVADRFATEIESASMDRGRAAVELFQLFQSFVGLIYSELADLHPGGRDVVGYVKTFFAHYNQQHLDQLPKVKEQTG